MDWKPWLVAAPFAFALSPAAAGTPATDWKFYGGVSSKNGSSWCFYDANRVVREPADHVGLPAKCLPQTDVDAVDTKTVSGGAIERNLARLRRAHYVPPYTKAESMEKREADDIARLEQIADVADIAPRVEISYELDCARHLARELSLYVRVNENVRSVDRPTEWSDISPEANTMRLFRILCPRGRRAR
jgi:hypothetical protein